MPRIMCKDCLFSSHVNNPFHFVRIWDPARGFWERKPLTDLGIVLELGHCGHRCEFAAGAPRPMTIVTENGVHSVPVRFCGCLDPNTGEKMATDTSQLVRNGFWPATWGQPRTAFSIRLMKTFSLFANHAHMNAYDYMGCLRRKTDGVAPDDVEVSSLPSYRASSHPRTGPIQGIHACSSDFRLHNGGETARREPAKAAGVCGVGCSVPGVSSDRQEHGPKVKRGRRGRTVSLARQSRGTQYLIWLQVSRRAVFRARR